ncbi:MAG: HD domain-containing protein [Psychrobium sp.]|nr:HD domain-containing protein [Psychrobium sp.]
MSNNLELHQAYAWQTRFKNFIEQRMRLDAAHDIAHIERVVSTGIALAISEDADLNVVIPACWLHDCVNVPKDSPQRSVGSKLSAKRANQFLMQINYPRKYFSDIEHAISAHSYSANIPTTTVEARVVQDADRLDALGAVGLSRCLMLAPSFGSQLYHPSDPFANQRVLNDKKFCIDHFYIKLKGLVDTMKTQAGHLEAKKRWDFMQSYLDQLANEIGK